MNTVSVIIPVYNRAHSVARAIDSVLSQELPDGKWSLQLILVDDGSTDNLAEALVPYGDRVLCIRHDRNRGAAAARNTGIAAAEGGYLAFLDSDDTWLPGKLVAQLDFMRANAVLASCTSYYVCRAKRPTIVSPQNQTEMLSLSRIVWGCVVSPGSTLVCERSVFNEIGLLDASLPRFEDWDWLLRYTRLHHLGFLAKPLTRVNIGSAANADVVLRALERMRTKHQGDLTNGDRRNFRAALELERAAAHFRCGALVSAGMAFLRSLWLVPLGNKAISAVLYNRLPQN